MLVFRAERTCETDAAKFHIGVGAHGGAVTITPPPEFWGDYPPQDEGGEDGEEEEEDSLEGDPPLTRESGESIFLII